MAFPGPTLWQSKPSIKACSCTALSSTDDIQMMLFTAEGLLRAYVRNSARGICHVPSVIHHALLRWYVTQGGQPGIEVWGWMVG